MGGDGTVRGRAAGWFEETLLVDGDGVTAHLTYKPKAGSVFANLGGVPQIAGDAYTLNGKTMTLAEAVDPAVHPLHVRYQR